MRQTNRKEANEQDVLVISRTDEGFRVYSAANPTVSYLVTGSPEDPLCSCSEFQDHEHRQGEAQWRCKHIAAVLSQFSPSTQHRVMPDYDEIEERRAIQDEGQPSPPLKEAPKTNGNLSQMLIKRSVSPDGRIDSLSVEFSHPLEEDSVRDIKDKAFKTLLLQSDIVGFFLGNGKGKKPTQHAHSQQDGDGAIPATMLDIAGMPGKWGRRLFINVSANGQAFKLFGSKQQLSEFVTAAGFWNMAEQVAEGARLNLPCRITTKPSPDGRYTNVDRVLPLQMPPPQRRAG